MPRRLIAHLDMDAFYASVELLRYPQLRGQPVVIGGGRKHQPVPGPDGALIFATLRDYVGRGVITTATYPARDLGVHSGMGLMKAAALAPQAVLLPVDFDQYRHFSRLFKAAVATVASIIEDRGIDEIYIDLTEVDGAQAVTPDDAQAGVRALAQRIKTAVTDATGLSCSIGVTPNKLLSKICSDLDKPDGLTLLLPEEIPTRIWPLSASRINGVGPKARARLEHLGVRTIGELAAADPQWLVSHFGDNYGPWLHRAAHGVDDSPVVTFREAKSLSRETTFERDLHPRQDREALGVVFTRLCEQVSQDLARKGLVGRSIGIKLRYDDFRILTRSVTLPDHTADAAEIRRWAGRCLKTVPLDQRLRLLGVKVEGLCSRALWESRHVAEGALPAMHAVQESLPLFGDADKLVT
jgi:DNA polymerase-4